MPAGCFPRLPAVLIVATFSYMTTRINVRAKGATGEREAANLLQKVVDEVYTKCGYVPPKIRRNVEQTQVGGEDLVGLPWYSFEIKRVERVDLDKWWAQTLVQAARKAPAASTAEVQRLGGWKALQAADAARTGAEAVGSLPLQEAALVAPAGPGEVGSAGLQDGRLLGAGGAVAVPGWAVAGGQLSTEVGQCTDEHCLGGGRIVGIPLPSWATGLVGIKFNGLELVPSAKGLPLDRSPLVGGPNPVLGSGGLSEGQGEAVSSPLAGVSPCVATLDASKGPNALNPSPMAREGVLLWRTNARPWQVRFLGTLITHNGERLASVVDTSLETWLKVFRADLEYRLIN